MRVAVIGPLEVRTDESAPVPVPGAKERLLLGALVAGAPGAVSTDSLAEALWDGDPPVSARKSLQAHVVRLRSALEPGRPAGSPGRFVVRRGPGYALTLDRGSIDALRMTDLAARGAARLAAGELVEAERDLRTAVALWRGAPYADWPDAGFAEVERRRLAEVRASAVGALIEARLQLGRHAEVLPELERLVTEEPLREGWWRLLMLALYRAGRQGEALAAGRRVRALLAEELGAEPGPALRAMEQAVLAQDPSLTAVPLPPPRPDDAVPAPGSCPYKGLAAYQVDDAPLFHGRRRIVEVLVARLVDAPLLVVSGPSGAGKSSVVRAGLVPALSGGALPASRTWRAVIVTPGRTPVDVLARLSGDPPPADPVLLVCDQFEELWAPGIDPVERTAFLDAVLGLIADGIVARCVVVVRGDHVGRLAEHPAFTDHPGAAFVLVPPFTEPELRELVQEPARAVGLRVDPELVDAVVADVLGRAGALPLLSTALVGTWQRRRGDVLTLAGYLEAGGVAGALTRSAESAYAALDEAGQDVARQILVRLADTDDGGTLVRRPVPLAELDLSGPRRAVVETFVDRRLLAVDGDRLEVVHEALLTAWPRLTRWLEEDAVGRAVRRHLTPAAREWDEAGRPDDELYRGARLSGALDWATAAGAELTPVEADFLETSRAHAERELSAARERAEREAAARHRTRRLATVLAMVLVVALVAAGLAAYFQQDADDRATEAELASRVADANWLTSRTEAAMSLDTAVLLAATAVRLAETPETQDGLLTLLAEHRRVVRAVPLPGRVQAGGVDGAGTLWLGVGDRIVAWPTRGRGLPSVAVSLDATWGRWYGGDPSPVTDTMATSGVAENGEFWVRLVGPEGEVTSLLEGEEVGGLPVGVSHTADGETLELLVVEEPPGNAEGPASWRLRTIGVDGGPASDTGAGGIAPAALASLDTALDARARLAVLWATDDDSAVLVDLAAGGQTPLRSDAREAESLGFELVGDGVVQLWDDGLVTRYGRDGQVLQQLDAHTAPVRRAVVSPMGWAATVGADGVVVRWAVDPVTGEWSQPESLTGHRGDVSAADVDPTGSLLVTAGQDDTAIVWDMRPDGAFGAAYPDLGGRWVSNRPRAIEPEGVVVFPTRPVTRVPGTDPLGPPDDTRQVAATFLDVDTGEVVREVPLGETLPLVLFGSSVAVRPDGRAVAVTWGLGASVLDAEGRRLGPDVVLPPVEGSLWDGEPMPATVFWSAGWTRDGSRLLLGAEGDPATGEGARLLVVDPATGEVEDRLDIGVSAQAIAPSPDGAQLAIASAASEQVVLLDADTLEVDATVDLLDGDRPFDIAWSSDGRLLAVVGDAGLLHVVDVESGQAREPVSISPQILLQVEWLPDDRTVATAAMDGTVALFDVERGLPRTGPLPASGAGTAAYTRLLPGPDDELIAFSGELPGRRYPLDPDQWLAAACAVAGRDLTRAEWERFLPARDWQPTCTNLD